MPTRSVRDLLLFFSALLLSAFGYEFVFLVMTVHVYDLSRDALSMGIFTTLTFVPRLFSSFLGGIADRLGKGRCLCCSALALVILLFVLSRCSNLRQIYALWLVVSVFLTFIVNSRGSLMAEIVASERYAAGNALSLALLNAAKLLAPLSAGYASMYFGSGVLLRFSCLIYLLTALAAIAIRSEATTRRGDPGFLRNAGRGFQFIRTHRIFGQMVAIAFFWRLFLGLQVSLFVIYVKDFLMCSNGQYGAFTALIGLGSIAGSLLGPVVAKWTRAPLLIRAGLGLHYASFILLGLCRSYAVALLVAFVSYLVFYTALVGLHSLRDTITPAGIRSSAYGTVTAMLTPPAIVSMLAGAYLAGQFGVARVLAGAGFLALASLCVILAVSANSRLPAIPARASKDGLA